MTLQLPWRFWIGCRMRPGVYLSDNGLDLLLRNAAKTINNWLGIFKTKDGRFDANITGTTVQDIRNFISQLFFNMFRARGTYISKWVGTGCCHGKRQRTQKLIRQGVIVDIAIPRNPIPM